VEGPASSIPEKIEINIESLDLGQTMRIKDLKPIPDCRYVEDPEQVVAAILLKRLEEPAPAVPGAPEMPEVIGKKKEEEGEEAEKEPEGKKKDKDAEGKK